MRRIVFGAILGATAMYFMDPGHGEARRNKVLGRAAERKETVLEAARSTAAAVSGATKAAAPATDERLDAVLPSKGKSSNGGPVQPGAAGQKSEG